MPPALLLSCLRPLKRLFVNQPVGTALFSPSAEINSKTTLRLRGFIRGLMFPLALLVLTLKTIRVLGARELQGAGEVLLLYRSDFALLLVFGALGAGAMLFLHGRKRDLVLVALQVAGVAWACIEIVAHQFYVATGSTIDFGIVLFSMQRLNETSQVFSSELPLLLILLLGLVILIIGFLPWYIVRNAVVHQHPRPVGRRAVLVMVSALLVSSAWSTIPLNDADPGFARSSLVNFAFSMTRLDEELTADLVEREALHGLTLPVDDPLAPRKNLVVIILESTRADATTPYNPEMATTPFLDSLKNRSLFAEQAYAVVPHTSKALVAILCGIEPHLTMPITEAEEGGIPGRCLPFLLEQAGYRSVYFQSATREFEAREGLIANIGFDDFYSLENFATQGLETANYFGVEDAVMLPASRTWLAENGDTGPFLAVYLTNTPHHDYQAPRQRYGFKQFVEDEEFNRYLNAVHYVDQFSRELVDQYRNLGHLEDTLFVFIGDHGEAFNEHGRYQHDNIMWQEGLHVPLLIYDPVEATGRTVANPVSQLDLMPSLLETLGYSVAGGNLPGELLWHTSDDRTLYAHCWYELGCMASIRGQQKYIEHFGRRPNELYDLHADQAETRNLVQQLSSGDSQRLRMELFSWRQSVNSLYVR